MTRKMQNRNGISNADLDSQADPVEPALLKHNDEVYSRRGRPATAEIGPPQPPLPHGYNGLPAAPQLSPILPKTDPEAQIHPALRSNAGYAQHMNMMPATLPHPPEPTSAVAGPSAPAIVSPTMAMSPSGDLTADGRKAKRELSQSKRAAQNRAAQRAFRQRKEGYIKKLEQQVREYAEMENNNKMVQAENYALREYIINLQSKLIEAKEDLPAPPPNVNIVVPQVAAPNAPLPPNTVVDSATHHHSALPPPPGNPLAQVAQAVAQLGQDSQYASKHYKPDAHDDSRTADDEIRRQLQVDGLPSVAANM